MESGTHTKGFTLIEVMLYVAISAGMLFAVASLYQLINEHKAANYAESRVNQSGMNALRVLSDALRRAESVYQPTHEEITDILILTMEDPALNPTTFALSEGTIVMQEGEEEPVPITSSDVDVYYVQFENLSTTDISDSIHFEIGVAFGLNSERATTDYTSTFYGSATTR